MTTPGKEARRERVKLTSDAIDVKPIGVEQYDRGPRNGAQWLTRRIHAAVVTAQAAPRMRRRDGCADQ
jgi:hypothetical protein